MMQYEPAWSMSVAKAWEKWPPLRGKTKKGDQPSRVRAAGGLHVHCVGDRNGFQHVGPCCLSQECSWLSADRDVPPPSCVSRVNLRWQHCTVVCQHLACNSYLVLPLVLSELLKKYFTLEICDKCTVRTLYKLGKVFQKWLVCICSACELVFCLSSCPSRLFVGLLVSLPQVKPRLVVELFVGYFGWLCNTYLFPLFSAAIFCQARCN